jgi:hypothetical protein
MGLGPIQAKREAAAKARRLALAVSRAKDQQRILTYADQLEKEADQLEREIAAKQTSPPVTQMQTQVQQQSGAPSSQDDKKPD